jgi:NADPH:quinone reductase-like Zn-dependent oxidoreductase
MKAAIVQAAGSPPVYGDIAAPTATADEVVVNVTAAALSNLTKMRAAGTHYSSASVFPFVPGFDGVGTVEGTGERVYFAFPSSTYGALGQKALVKRSALRPIPSDLSDVAAASVANPGMSAWASMVHRAHLVKGETVLVNGATGTAGRLCVQLAKLLGAGRVIATGRNAKELEEVKALGADVALAFDLPGAEAEFRAALVAQFRRDGGKGIDVVIDYLYGPSTAAIFAAIPGSLEDGHRVRYVNVGTAARVDEIPISAGLLRSSALELMGSGLSSVPESVLLDSIAEVFKVASKIKLGVDDVAVPLEDISKAWAQKGAKPRIVITI